MSGESVNNGDWLFDCFDDAPDSVTTQLPALTGLATRPPVTNMDADPPVGHEPAAGEVFNQVDPTSAASSLDSDDLDAWAASLVSKKKKPPLNLTRLARVGGIGLLVVVLLLAGWFGLRSLAHVFTSQPAPNPSASATSTGIDVGEPVDFTGEQLWEKNVGDDAVCAPQTTGLVCVQKDALHLYRLADGGEYASVKLDKPLTMSAVANIGGKPYTLYSTGAVLNGIDADGGSKTWPIPDSATVAVAGDTPMAVDAGSGGVWILDGQGFTSLQVDAANVLGAIDGRALVSEDNTIYTISTRGISTDYRVNPPDGAGDFVGAVGVAGSYVAVAFTDGASADYMFVGLADIDGNLRQSVRIASQDVSGASWVRSNSLASAAFGSLGFDISNGAIALNCTDCLIDSGAGRALAVTNSAGVSGYWVDGRFLNVPDMSGVFGDVVVSRAGQVVRAARL